MKRLLGAVLLAGLGGVAILLLVPWNGGPLDESGNAFGGPVQAGRAFTAFYDLRNNGGRSIEVVDVSLADHSRALVLLGARAQTGGSPLAGAWPDFPPPHTKSVPAKKFVVPPHADVPLLVGLEAEQVGDYFLMGVKVEYRVRYVGELGPRYRRTLTTRMAVCSQLQPLKPRRQSCRVPEIPE